MNCTMSSLNSDQHILLLEQCSWAHFTWPPYLATILGHHTWPYLATILGHHGRKTRITVTNHLDTVSTVDPTNIMSHLISWMSNYAEPKPTLKTQATYFHGGPLSAHPSQAPNFLLTTNPFNPFQAKRSPSPAKICHDYPPKRRLVDRCETI